jgi:predicted nucleic acid-binding protein
VKLLLDTAVLGWICHPRKHADVRQWFAESVQANEMLISEVSDYELRRELLRIGASRSLARLDELGRELRYLPVTTSTFRTAARLWAVSRGKGRPTADAHALDADVLIAAQALAEEAVVVTSNPKHFEGVVSALRWQDLHEK